MSGDEPTVDMLHTVAVYVPGTSARVHVTELLGPADDACQTAQQIVRDLVSHPASQWHAKSVEAHECTTVPDHLHNHL